MIGPARARYEVCGRTRATRRADSRGEGPEHGLRSDLDRAVPGRRTSRPRQTGAELRYPIDSLMRSALIVIGDVCHDGAAKVIFRKEDEVVQALPLQTAHEPFDVGGRVGDSVRGGHSRDAQDLTQPQVQGTAMLPDHDLIMWSNVPGRPTSKPSSPSYST